MPVGLLGEQRRMARVRGLSFFSNSAIVGKMEAVLGPGRHRHDLEAALRGVAVVVGVKGLGDDDLVARVGHGVEGEGDGLAAAGGDDDVLVFQLDLEIVRNSGPWRSSGLRGRRRGRRRGPFPCSRRSFCRRPRGYGCRAGRCSDGRRWCRVSWRRWPWRTACGSAIPGCSGRAGKFSSVPPEMLR